MSKQRIMSSKVLGEATDRVREKMEIGEIEGDQYLWIKGKKNPEIEELLKRSVIVVANSPSSSSVILDHILAEGVYNVKIRPLGGLLHLLSFDNIEDKRAMVDCQWLQRWFMEIREVSDSNAAIWRETWISIYGVPLSAWAYDNFFEIGSIYGKVQSVDYSRMDYARVLIITDCLFHINNPILFSVEGKNFKIFVTENNGIPMNHATPADEKKDDNPVWMTAVNEESPGKSQLGIGNVERKEDESSMGKGENTPCGALEVSPIALGTDTGNNNYELMISPNKTRTVSPTSKTQKPPKYPNNPKTQLIFNSPTRSPLSQKNLRNFQNSQSNQNFQSLEKLNLSTPPLQDQSGAYGAVLGPTDGLTKTNQETNNFFPYHNPSGGPIDLTKSPKPTKHKSPLASPSPKINSNLSQTSQPSFNIQYVNPTVPTSNTFNPLSKPSQKNLTSNSLSSSTSTSNPSIPPGFEDFIPSPLKEYRDQRKMRKLKKKKMRKQASLSSQKSPHLSHPSHTQLANQNEATATEIIELGLKLGMNFKGPLSELHGKIMDILARQKEDWQSNQ